MTTIKIIEKNCSIAHICHSKHLVHKILCSFMQQKLISRYPTNLKKQNSSANLWECFTKSWYTPIYVRVQLNMKFYKICALAFKLFLPQCLSYKQTFPKTAKLSSEHPKDVKNPSKTKFKKRKKKKKKKNSFTLFVWKKLKSFLNAIFYCKYLVHKVSRDYVQQKQNSATCWLISIKADKPQFMLRCNLI